MFFHFYISLTVLCQLLIFTNAIENTHESSKCRRWFLLLSKKGLYPSSGFFIGRLIYKREKPEEVGTVTVINPEWAITLARPFFLYGNNTEYYGINHFSNNYLILQIIINPDYEVESNNNNVALLKVNSMFCFNKDFAPIIKATPLRSDYYMCAILRYGDIYQTVHVIQKLSEMILPESDCRQLLIRKPETKPKTWCHVIDDFTCEKDTGAPITCEPKKPDGRLIQGLLAPPINGTLYTCKKSVEDIDRMPAFVVDLGRVYDWIRKIVDEIVIEPPPPKPSKSSKVIEL